MDRGPWWGTVHGITKKSDMAEQLTHTHTQRDKTWLDNQFSSVSQSCLTLWHHTLPHGNLMSWPSGFGWTLISPAAEKNPWYLPKEGNKTELCCVWILGEVTGKGSCWLVHVSDSPKILEATAIPPFKRTRWVHLQRPGSWVMSSCISRSLIKEMTGLAWQWQCKYLERFRY